MGPELVIYKSLLRTLSGEPVAWFGNSPLLS